jgi:hypothetical protein
MKNGLGNLAARDVDQLPAIVKNRNLMLRLSKKSTAARPAWRAVKEDRPRERASPGARGRRSRPSASGSAWARSCVRKAEFFRWH